MREDVALVFQGLEPSTADLVVRKNLRWNLSLQKFHDFAKEVKFPKNELLDKCHCTGKNYLKWRKMKHLEGLIVLVHEPLFRKLIAGLEKYSILFEEIEREKQGVPLP